MPTDGGAIPRIHYRAIRKRETVFYPWDRPAIRGHLICICAADKKARSLATKRRKVIHQHAAPTIGARSSVWQTGTGLRKKHAGRDQSRQYRFHDVAGDISQTEVASLKFVR